MLEKEGRGNGRIEISPWDPTPTKPTIVGFPQVNGLLILRPLCPTPPTVFCTPDKITTLKSSLEL